MWLKGALQRGWRVRFDVVVGGDSTLLEGALPRGWRRFGRGWRGRFGVVGVG